MRRAAIVLGGLLALVWAGIFVHSALAGGGVQFALSGIADDSHLIVIGKVKALKQIEPDEWVEGWWMAQISVLSVLKGECEHKDLEFEYRTYHYKQGTSHRWKIEVGDSMVFFIKRFEGKYYLTSIGAAAKFDEYFIEPESSTSGPRKSGSAPTP
jgi:hypothetical protein